MQELIGRILLGKFKYRDIVFILPKISTEYKISLYSKKIRKKYRYNDWITSEFCDKVLRNNSLWDDKLERELNDLDKDIEAKKIEIYKAYFNIVQRDFLRIELADLRQRQNFLYNIKHSFDYLTLDGFVDILIKQFTIIKMVYKKGKLLYPKFWDCPLVKMQSLYNIYHQNEITSIQFREIARNDEWASYWRTRKEQLFAQFGVDLSIEQRHLILYSQMYDNVREHPESPTNDIINDDDALDGWFLVQAEKRKAEKNNSNIDNVLGSNSKDQELFLPAHTLEDIERINNMNTLEGKMIKAQRMATVDKFGVVSESSLPDKKMEINSKMADMIRG